MRFALIVDAPCLRHACTTQAELEEVSAMDVVSPACSLELFGGKVGAMEEGVEVAGAYFDAGTSAPVHKKGLAPNWDKEFCVACWEPESTFLLLTISKEGSLPLARACAPLTAVRPGYRMLPLRSPNGSALEEGSAVLCHITVEPLESTANVSRRVQCLSIALRGAGL